MVRIEGLALGDERPGQMQELVGGGTTGDFDGLAGRSQAVVEGLHRGGVLGAAEPRQ